MASYRSLAGGLLLAASFSTAFAQGTMSCTRVDMTPPVIRAQGMAELLPDIVLDCTGGSPTANGEKLPDFEILAIANSAMSNRLVETSDPDTSGPIFDQPLPPVMSWNDAVLILDDPLPSQQTACVPAARTDACPSSAGGIKLNVFQGQQLQSNIVLFHHVPIDPPGAGKTRRIRITNLRVDASQVPEIPVPAEVPTEPEPRTLTLLPQVYTHGGKEVSIGDAQMDIALTPGAVIELRTTDDEALDPTQILTLTPAMVPQNAPGPSVGFNIKFTEGFKGAFKRRNLGTSGTTPNLLANQADVAFNFYTESGYFNGNLPLANDLNLIGLADTGTRLKLTISGVPENVFLYVSTRDVENGTTNWAKATPRAILSYTDLNGAGPLQQNLPPGTEDFNVVQPTNGVATMAWEVVAADPSKLESLSFNVRIMAPNGVARLGVAEWEASLGPIHPGVPVPTPPLRMPFPAFKQDPDAEPQILFRVVPTLSGTDITTVSAATLTEGFVAPGSIVTTFGTSFVSTTLSAFGPPTKALGPISVDVVDILGVRHDSAIYYISPSQLNYVLAEDIPPGPAVINVTFNGSTIASGSLRVGSVAPGLFSLTGNGQGLPAGFYLSTDGWKLLGRYNSQNQTWTPEPIVVGQDTYISLYGTGIRGRTGLGNVSVTIGGVEVPVTFAGGQSGFAGLDQVNAGPLPATLKGKGLVPLVLKVDEKTSNTLSVEVAP